MKGLKILFAVCLAMVGTCRAGAVDGSDAVRATVRRVSSVSTNSGNISSANNTRTKVADRQSDSGATQKKRSTGQVGTTVAVRERGVATTGHTTTNRGSVTSGQNTNVVKSATASRGTLAGTQTRSNAVVRQRSSTPETSIRNATVTARTAVATNGSRTQSKNTSGTKNVSRKTLTRAGTTAAVTVMSQNYKNCRETYYNCMDEFCANKDAQLKRCACSDRLNEFNSVKQSLSDVEDELLAFNQRLLSVGMEKEDALAMVQETEGETAFNVKDTSESKKILDEITQKLTSTFNNTSLEQNLSAISISLDSDASFDSIDYLGGVETTTKSGTALYSAALPMCREMVLETCSEEELSLAESSYQMLIEQDCNTVKKAYQAKTDQARDKIREGSALLDMSRLDLYQKHNSDDVLTCKKNMLERLTDASVCGTDMIKCLDISGHYIDPTTGTAFLTDDLIGLGSLINRPTNGETWTQAPGNTAFVTYLNDKKKYIEPATETCQDIASTIWDEFIEDALAQIKLAQEKKLEEMRQSCTSLTVECMSDADKSISDFDARALSIFGVQAFQTASAMCAEITSACTALMNGLDSSDDSDSLWAMGIADLSDDVAFEKIISSCSEVGRNCIVRTCKSVSSNFGLCDNIETSINRHSIINRSACWDEVFDCVASAGDDRIQSIIEHLRQNGVFVKGADDKYANFYSELYETHYPASVKGTPYCTSADYDNQCVNNPCDDSVYCKNDNDKSVACYKCRITEYMWGNCEVEYNKSRNHNHIRRALDGKTTLLEWFAKNTNTIDNEKSCIDTSCPTGMVLAGSGECVSADSVDSCGNDCAGRMFQVSDTRKYCCGNDLVYDGTVCPVNSGLSPIDIRENSVNFLYANAPSSSPGNNYSGIGSKKVYYSGSIKPLLWITDGNKLLVCVGGVVTGGEVANGFPKGQKLTCNGKFMWVDYDEGGVPKYYIPDYNASGSPQQTSPVVESIIPKCTESGEMPYSDDCTYKPNTDSLGGTWKDSSGNNCSITNPSGWEIRYSN